jgi:hypothetical protein
MALAQNVWQAAPLFYGMDARPREDLGAEEFMDRQEALLAANAQAATGPEKIASTVANFRSQARDWWTKTLPFTEEDDVLQQLQNDWDIFKARFVKEYFPFYQKSDAKINWVAFTQAQTESTYLFIQRVANAAGQFAKLIFVPGDDAAAANFVLPEDDARGFRAAAVADVAGLNAPARLEIAFQTNKLKVEFRQQYAKRYTNCMVSKVVLNGLKETRLRLTILKCVNEDDSLARLLEKVRLAESQLTPSSYQQGKGVASMSGETASNAPDGNNVDAVNARGGRNNNNSNKNNNNATGGNNADKSKKKKFDKSKKCNHCGRIGHVEADCRTKAKQLSAAAQEKSGSGRSSDAPFPPGGNPSVNAVDSVRSTEDEALNRLLTF